MSLLDRLGGTIDPTISAHQFYGALVAFADGELTRAQIEAGFGVDTAGVEAVELDFLINTYTGITPKDFSAVGNAAIRSALEAQSVLDKQRRYLDTLHAIFLLTEHRSFDTTFDKAAIQAWLTNAAS